MRPFCSSTPRRKASDLPWRGTSTRVVTGAERSPAAKNSAAKATVVGAMPVTRPAARVTASIARPEKRKTTLAPRMRPTSTSGETTAYPSIASVAAETREAERALQRARAEKAALLARLERSAEEQRSSVVALEDKTSRLEALLELLETRGRALPAGVASIRKYKGALDWPAPGKVVVPFGRIANPRFPKTFLRSSGWTIDVPTGTAVRAVFAGDVVYAQWLKGYGNLVVLDHGDGVFTLYGHLLTGTAPRGTRVALGEVVGRVADPPEDEVPGVYFEIRESRTSVDPRGWLR